MSSNLRAWQRAALDNFLANKPRDFLAVATPGAGKTTFALRVATELKASRTVDRIIVVVPTEHLKVQWSQAMLEWGWRWTQSLKTPAALIPHTTASV